MEHDAGTIDTSGHNIVGVDKEDETGAHHGDPENDVKPRSPPTQLAGGFAPCFDALTQRASGGCGRGTRSFVGHKRRFKCENIKAKCTLRRVQSYELRDETTGEKRAHLSFLSILD